MVFRSRRLEDLFGGTLDAISYADVVSLLGNPDAAEAEDLDFKRDHYTSDPKSREELAKDVAAFANHIGGVIVLGIADARGVPSKAFDVDLADHQVRDLQQRIAATTAPPVRWEAFRKENPSNPGHGVLLITVPRSPQAPHAVTAATTRPTEIALRYPRRAGSKTDWLTETHVATAYHQRFQDAVDRRQRMADVHDHFLADALQRDAPHLLVALVPDTPGDMPINQQSFNAHAQTIQDHQPLLGLAEQPFAEVRVGPRMLRLDWPTGHRRDKAYLYDDGAGIWALPIPARLHSADDDTQLWAVSVELVVHRLISALAFLATHARDRCGAMGTAVVEATLVNAMYSHPRTRTAPPMPRPGVPVRDPVYLLGVHQRRAPESPMVSAGARAEISALLDDLADESVPLVQAASALSDRLFHTFGLPEVRCITAEGALRQASWVGGELGDRLIAWASERSVPVI
ncbi:ATP-binding protein (plasmid) [Streptomycetaceae bacterium NBC_01309]